VNQLEQNSQVREDPMTLVWIVCLGVSLISMLLASTRYATQTVPLGVLFSRLLLPLVWAVMCYLSVPITAMVVLTHLPTSKTRLNHAQGAVLTCIFTLTIAFTCSLLNAVASQLTHLSLLFHPLQRNGYTSPARDLGSLVTSSLPSLLLTGLSLLFLSYSAQTLIHRERKAANGRRSVDLTPPTLTFTTTSDLYLAVELVQRMRGVNLYLLSLLPLAMTFLAGWIGLYGYLKAEGRGENWLIATGALCLVVAATRGLAG